MLCYIMVILLHSLILSANCVPVSNIRNKDIITGTDVNKCLKETKLTGSIQEQNSLSVHYPLNYNVFHSKAKLKFTNALGRSNYLISIHTWTSYSDLPFDTGTVPFGNFLI